MLQFFSFCPFIFWFTITDEEERLDQLLSVHNLREATKHLQDNTQSISMTRDRLLRIFEAIEVRTMQDEEQKGGNGINTRMPDSGLGAVEGTGGFYYMNNVVIAPEDLEDEYHYSSSASPPFESTGRMEMADMYHALRSVGHLKAYGAVSPSAPSALSKNRINTNNNVSSTAATTYPVSGYRLITQEVLEDATGLDVHALAPENQSRPEQIKNILLGIVAMVAAEALISLVSGVSLPFLLLLVTPYFLFMDRLVANGACTEAVWTRLVVPELNERVLRHEAGHFLCAYLLGCPVVACVLSGWEALGDVRFGGSDSGGGLISGANGGTMFFDPVLTDEIERMGDSKGPGSSVSQSSIDRLSVIVMGGIAAEAIHFGRANGGSGDKNFLEQFLASLGKGAGKNSGKGSSVWSDAGLRKNQAMWGVMQAVEMLKEYRDCYEALVETLRNGGDMGECVYAIEKAANEKGLGPMTEPRGYILDTGTSCTWVESKSFQSRNISK